jgi:hypothetical protein
MVQPSDARRGLNRFFDSRLDLDRPYRNKNCLRSGGSLYASVDDFVAVEASKFNRDQRRSRGEAATHSTPITCGLQNSIQFNKDWNLVRDQGVGGSNPLSPTNLFKHLNSTSGFPSTLMVSKL